MYVILKELATRGLRLKNPPKFQRTSSQPGGFFITLVPRFIQNDVGGFENAIFKAAK